MSTYTVTFEVTPPVDATSDQVEEWVKFQIGNMGGMSLENPLSDYDLESDNVSVN